MTPPAAGPLTVELLNWTPVTRDSGLRGYADVRLGKTLRINGIAVGFSKGTAWAATPSKSVGGARYVKVVEWLDRESSDRFAATVLPAVEALYPRTTT